MGHGKKERERVAIMFVRIVITLLVWVVITLLKQRTLLFLNISLTLSIAPLLVHLSLYIPKLNGRKERESEQNDDDGDRLSQTREFRGKELQCWERGNKKRMGKLFICMNMNKLNHDCKLKTFSISSFQFLSLSHLFNNFQDQEWMMRILESTPRVQ